LTPNASVAAPCLLLYTFLFSSFSPFFTFLIHFCPNLQCPPSYSIFTPSLLHPAHTLHTNCQFFLFVYFFLNMLNLLFSVTE
jgi:hypothetical protein